MCSDRAFHTQPYRIAFHEGILFRLICIYILGAISALILQLQYIVSCGFYQCNCLHMKGLLVETEIKKDILAFLVFVVALSD